MDDIEPEEELGGLGGILKEDIDALVEAQFKFLRRRGEAEHRFVNPSFDETPPSTER
jgi:hypothetical protein